MIPVKLVIENLDKIVKSIIAILLFILGYGWYGANNDALKWETNYNSYVEETTSTINKLGDTIKTVKSKYLTVRELKNTKDKQLSELYNKFNNVKKNNHLLRARLKTENTFKTNITKSLIHYTDSVSETDKELFEVTKADTTKPIVAYDTYDNGILSLTRVEQQDTSSLLRGAQSYYHYTYTPTIFGKIGWYKAGKWKPINIIKWRKKLWDFSITSNDSNMVIDSINVIYTGKIK